jgi:hypothetical protein
VREVERVIGDHEVGPACSLAGGLSKTGRDERAAAAGAPVGSDGEFRPEHFRRLELELCAVAGLGLVEPALHRLPRLPVSALGNEERLEAVQLPAAQVVLPALQDDDVDLTADRGRCDRNIFREQLLLQRLGRGCDDNALA